MRAPQPKKKTTFYCWIYSITKQQIRKTRQSFH